MKRPWPTRANVNTLYVPLDDDDDVACFFKDTNFRYGLSGAFPS